MKAIIYCLAISSVICNILQAEVLLTWDTAVQQTLEKNCALPEAELNINIASSEKSQSKVLPNPEMGVEVEPDNEGWHSQPEVTVAISQLIELGGKRGFRYEIADAEENAAGYNYELIKIDLLNRLCHAFIDTAASQAQLTLAKEQVKIASDIHEALSIKTNSGASSKVQASRAKISLSSSQIALEKHLQTYQLAKKKLAGFWKACPETFDRLDFDLFKLETLPSLDQFQACLEERPDIHLILWEWKSAYAAWDLEKANAIPDVVVTGGYTFAEEKGDNGVVFGLEMPIPIFDRNKGNINAACFRVQQAQYEYHHHLMHLKKTTENLYAESLAAYREAESLKDLVKNDAEQLYLDTKEAYTQGKFDYLALLDAQQTYCDTKQKYLEAAANFHHKKCDLDYLIINHD